MTALNSVKRSATKDAVKKMAERVILARYPDWKQRNMLAAASIILQKLSLGQSLTTAEEAQRQGFNQVWTWVAAVRAHSDQLEALVDQGQPINLEEGWPE